jgi:hypothetical protein
MKLEESLKAKGWKPVYGVCAWISPDKSRIHILLPTGRRAEAEFFPYPNPSVLTQEQVGRLAVLGFHVEQ